MSMPSIGSPLRYSIASWRLAKSVQRCGVTGSVDSAVWSLYKKGLWKAGGLASGDDAKLLGDGGGVVSLALSLTKSHLTSARVR